MNWIVSSPGLAASWPHALGARSDPTTIQAESKRLFMDPSSDDAKVRFCGLMENTDGWAQMPPNLTGQSRQTSEENKDAE
jgi:hypothetical protein